MKLLKTIKWEALLKGIMYILVGVVALVVPDTMVRTLGYALGVILILAGAVSMICYLLRDARQNYYHDDFMYGLLGIGVGCFVLYRVDWIVSVIPILLGIMVLVSGASKLQDVIDMKRLESGSWIVMLVLAVLNLAIGFVLLLYPFETAMLLLRVVGAGLIFSGVTDVAATVYFANSITSFQRKEKAAMAEEEKKASPAGQEETGGFLSSQAQGEQAENQENM